MLHCELSQTADCKGKGSIGLSWSKHSCSGTEIKRGEPNTEDSQRLSESRAEKTPAVGPDNKFAQFMPLIVSGQ